MKMTSKTSANNITGIPNNHKVDKPFGNAHCIYDPKTLQCRDDSINSWTSINYSDNQIKHNFFDTYKNCFSKPHDLNGIQEFTEACYTQGTTESFSHFYIRYQHKKRLRIARGDYFFHQMMSRLYWKDKFTWLEDDELREGDFLVISTPFSDTGNIYPNLDNILKKCDDLDIPVMLDMAYINIANNLKIDVSHRCIKYIVTSLSKPFPIEKHRIGIRLQRYIQKWEDQLYVINEDEYNYIPLINCHIGSQMMQKFDADYIPLKYKDKQIEICKELNVEPSSCVIFGIDHNDKFNEYNRGRDTNRLCFSMIWDGRRVYDRV